ncbi:MAG: hypothetical protein CMK59_14595 [Proteobacteria bacterium]|nr:hypothetical protein [Pseudomonadota bacterium]
MTVFPLAMMVALLTGCPKKDAAPDPTDPIAQSRYNFVQGVKVLQSPDRKTGEVNYQQAYDLFDQAAQVGSFPRAYYNAAWTAEQLGQNEKAEGHYRKAFEGDSGNTDYLYALTDLLIDNGKSAEAVPILQQKLESGTGNDIEFRYALIHAMTIAEQYDDAVKQIQQILLTDPQNVEAYRLLSRNYFSQGKYSMSLLCAEKAYAFAEGDPAISNNKGVTYLVMGDDVKAFKEFQAALEKEPNHLQANLNLGFTALNSGNYQLAQQSFDKALITDPSNLDGKLGLAVALRGLKDYKAAEKLYDELLKSDNKSKMVYFNAATLQEKYVEDYNSALKILEEYKALNPSDLDAQSRIERVQESKRIVEERKAEEERKRKEAEERAKRQREQFDNMKTAVKTLASDIQALESCEAAMEVTMEAAMYLEQGQMVIEMDDIDMAADVEPFINDAQNMIDAVKPECGMGGAEEPPAE